jgi:hypothetical protein
MICLHLFFMSFNSVIWAAGMVNAINKDSASTIWTRNGAPDSSIDKPKHPSERAIAAIIFVFILLFYCAERDASADATKTFNENTPRLFAVGWMLVLGLLKLVF